jgi:ribosomal protein S30
MIKAGDIVRWKNSALAKGNVLAIRNKHHEGKRYRSPRRGDQELHRVEEVCFSRWNWRTKSNHTVVRLENGQSVSTEWISFVRRPKNPAPQQHDHYPRFHNPTSYPEAVERLQSQRRSTPPPINDNSSLRRRSRRSIGA